MTFDLIIGNPPYQEMTNGGSRAQSAAPIYTKFMDKAVGLSPESIIFIIPSRWVTSQSPILTKFRQEILSSNHIAKLFSYETSTDIFPKVEIAGGVLYYHWSKHHSSPLIEIHNKNQTITHRSLQEAPVLDNKAYEIIKKILARGGVTMEQSIKTASPFGIDADYGDGTETISGNQTKVICSNNRIAYIKTDAITKNTNLIQKYKVITGRLDPDRGGVNTSAKSNVLNRPRILKPNEVCTQTFLILGAYPTEQEAENLVHHISLQLTRFLIHHTVTSISLNSKNFTYVPLPIAGITDLYDYYKLSQAEISYIEHQIKPWA